SPSRPSTFVQAAGHGAWGTRAAGIVRRVSVPAPSDRGPVPRRASMERLEFSWYIPNDGDGEHVGTWLPEIMPTLDNLTRVVQSAEAAGFDTVLVPTGQQNNTFST